MTNNADDAYALTTALASLKRERDGLREALEANDIRLTERIEWLRREAKNGGSWEYLKAKWEECERIREQLRALAISPASEEGT